MEKVLISACLCGDVCRWHGKKMPVSSVVKPLLKEQNTLFPKTEIIKVCPELLGGLTVPRPPVKRKNGKVFITCEDKTRRHLVTGKEVTASFELGAKKTLAIAKQNNIKKAILCKWSPSCDKGGITGKLLIQNGIEVINTF